MKIDLVLTSRGEGPIRDDVWDAIQAQVGVEIRVLRCYGPPRPGDRDRLETIVRARNEGKRLGSAPWVLLLDDDVILAPDAAARLVEALQGRPRFAAMGADYDGEMDRWTGSWDYPPHVGMGATLFRRSCLAGVTFRRETGKCECQCCCDDLRRARWGIGLVPGARAWHRPDPSRRDDLPSDAGLAAPDDGSEARPPRILTAFDRRHMRKFLSRFLPSLRRSGNHEPVTAFAYGLRSDERRRLKGDGVEVVSLPNNGTSPALRRLRDFPLALDGLPDDTPVAFWDAGDVLFQGPLGPLWDLVRAHPGKLLASREPLSHPETFVVEEWIGYIRDLEARARVFAIMGANPFLNSGFAAGTASAMRRYLREGDALLHSNELDGVIHWGDQVAMNVYCHTQPEVWQEIDEGWNYCLALRPPEQFRISPDGWTRRTDGKPVHVVHGNGCSLVWQALPVRI